MSLLKLAFSNKPITVSFKTDQRTWNEGLGKLMCAITYMSNVGMSRGIEIKDFYDSRLSALKTGIDGDGSSRISGLKIDDKKVGHSKVIRDKDNNEIDFEYHKEATK